jgi:hypothetical protein
MNILDERLAQIERHIAQGEQTVASQRKRIEKLEKQGLDATTSRALLTTLLETQRLRQEHRTRLLIELT